MATQQLNRLTGLLTAAYSANRFADESDGDLLDRCRTGADPAAFEAIVRRHGGRVLAACRKVLGDSADIDDAFQATFLILLRNPQAVHKAASLGAWLYGVAHRIAVRSRDTAHRRRDLLKNVARPADAEAPDLSWKEACSVLHIELDRLPDNLRLPLVLCYLDGLSRDEAAAQLGWSLNEVRGRLERGRDRLRKRLEKRGIALSAGLLAAVAGNSVTAGGPPTRFIEIAMRVAAGRPSGAAAALANGVSPAMVTTFKIVSAVVVTAGVLIGVGLRPDALAGQKPSDAKGAQASAPPGGPATPAAPPEFAGQVIGPDGKPVPGAKIHFLYYTPKALPVPERAVTDADGKFRFTVKADELDTSYRARPWEAGFVTAHAAGYGRGWTPIAGKPDQLNIRLAKDDKPLAGRLVNLEGQPIAGVTVRVTELQAPPEGKDLAGFTDDLKKRKAAYPVLRDRVSGFEGSWISRDLETLIPPVTTDKDGKFTISGVGVERVATIRIEGATVEARTLRVLTREAETVTIGEWEPAGMGLERAKMTFVGNDFTHALAPGRTVTGVVKDKATGKPIPGARVESEKLANNPVSGRFEFKAVADKDGVFTLHGLPLGKGNILRAAPPEGQSYLMQVREVPVPAGTNPAPLDFELTRGVELTVRVTDAASKAAVAGRAQYFALRDNPTVTDLKGFTTPGGDQLDQGDGVFKLIVPPGPGLVAFRTREDRYPAAAGAERFKDRMNGAFIDTVPYLCHAANFTALAPVDPKPGAQTAELAIALDPGKTVTGRVLGPDGKPLTGALARSLKPSPLVFGVWEKDRLKGAEFEAIGVVAKQPRVLVFVHKEKKLSGMIQVTGEEKGPVEVTLRPWATLTGRLVDADGRPQADVRLGFVQAINEPNPAGVGDLPDREVRTDAAGRFTLAGFVPGLRYNVSALTTTRIVGKVANGMRFKEGETKDVGDVVLKMFE